jgi:hypothetical protein
MPGIRNLGRFYSSYEVSKLLSVPPSIVPSLGIHQCPDGYSEVLIRRFCAEHSLPFDDTIYETIAVSHSTAPENELATWVDSWEEALLTSSAMTRVLIFHSGVPNRVHHALYPIIKTRSPPLFLISVGGPTQFCHVRADTWKEAFKYAKGFTG